MSIQDCYNIIERRTRMIDKQRRQFFITQNNPSEYQMDHDKIIEIMHHKFKHLVYWCMCDEIGESGTYHTHIFIVLSAKKRWSSVQRMFPRANISSDVHGSPQQVVSYIKKTASNLTEAKKETNLPETFYEEGTIPTFYLSESKVDMLSQIQDMLDSGMIPSEIMNQHIAFRQYETIIKKQFLQKRSREVPPKRELKFYYHVGASGSGKSYVYKKMVEKWGEDEVMYTCDYANKGSCAFDHYEGQKVVIMDEIKPDSIPFGMLLTLTDGYKSPIHCRYANAIAIYDEIHLMSVFCPEQLFDYMNEISDKKTDSIRQLLRRITTIIYHYKDGEKYCTYEMPGNEYVGYDDLKQKAQGKQKDGFVPCKESPFSE